MVSSRFVLALAASIALIHSSTSATFVKRVVSVDKPYSPDLYSRSILDNGEGESSVKKRSFQPSRPYAPELYARSALGDEIESTVEKRDLVDQLFLSTYETLQNNAACVQDATCESGYCGPKGKCIAKLANKKKCHQSHSACQSGFCSLQSDVCKERKSFNGDCVVSAGCLPGLSCVNSKCLEQNLHPAPSKRDDDNGEWHNPPKPHPSGSPSHPHKFHHHHHEHHNPGKGNPPPSGPWKGNPPPSGPWNGHN